MRKYTIDLLKGFYKICQNPDNKTGLKRIGLGLAIVLESGIEIKLKNGTDNLPMSEINAAFKEMIERDWLEEIEVSEDDKYYYYSDYKEQIMKAGFTFYSNLENMLNELKDFVWPFGDHWFLLTTKGEDFCKRDLERVKNEQDVAETLELPPVFPDIIPDKVIESKHYTLENDDFHSKEEVENLIKEMHNHPESDFYLYVQQREAVNKYIKIANENNEILMNECEFFYYRHPKNRRDYIKIQKNNIQFEWEKEVMETSPMYKQFKLALSEQKKRQLEIQEINIVLQQKSSIKRVMKQKGEENKNKPEDVRRAKRNVFKIILSIILAPPIIWGIIYVVFLYPPKYVIDTCTLDFDKSRKHWIEREQREGRSINLYQGSILDFELHFVLHNIHMGEGDITKPKLIITAEGDTREYEIKPKTSYFSSKKEGGNVTSFTEVDLGRTIHVGPYGIVDEFFEYSIGHDEKDQEIIEFLRTNKDKLRFKIRGAPYKEFKVTFWGNK